MASKSINALLFGLIDYAGLFPPAKLDMKAAAESYARHRRGKHADSLARFICPVSRLGEFAKAAAPHLPNTDAVPADPKRALKAKVVVPAGAALAESPALVQHLDPWTLSALIDGPLESNLRAIAEFNAAHHKNHHSSAVVDTVEIKVTTPDAIDAALDILPEEINPFFEIPHKGDVRTFAAALAGLGLSAKIRTGGTTPDMFPSVEQVADFLLVMHDGNIPFKATAGLHHPIRGTFGLTYEDDSPEGTMHGFVNLFLAATLVHDQGIDRATVIHLLGETDAESFRFTDAHAEWRGMRITTEAIAAARENFALCFGSCSMDDPIVDLAGLGWI